MASRCWSFSQSPQKYTDPSRIRHPQKCKYTLKLPSQTNVQYRYICIFCLQRAILLSFVDPFPSRVMIVVRIFSILRFTRYYTSTFGDSFFSEKVGAHNHHSTTRADSRGFERQNVRTEIKESQRKHPPATSRHANNVQLKPNPRHFVAGEQS